MAAELAGYVGGVLILAAYGLVSLGRLPARSYTNHALNVVGAAALGVNAFAHNATPNVALEVAWAGIGLVTIIVIARGAVR